MIKKIYDEEGISGFYKGIVPSLILTLNPVIQYTIYELLKKSFRDSNKQLSDKNIILISLISKFVTILANYPLMTIKTLFQANSNLSSKEVMTVIRKIWEEEGVLLGFYKGLSSKLAGSLISNMLLMLIYENVQRITRLLLVKFILGNKMDLIFNNVINNNKK